MNQYKMLLKNIGILTIGQFGTKILVFLLIPIYTNILTTSEYGAYDLLSTTISLLIPILTSNISVAAQRFSMDREYVPRHIVSISMQYTCLGLLGAILLTIINHIFKFSIILDQYNIAFLLLFGAQAINGLFVELAVGRNEIAHVSISGALSTVAVITFNILFLVIFRWGIVGYFAASFLGLCVQLMYIFLALELKKEIDFNQNKSAHLKRKMLAFSRPQIANNIGWWINNVSDRYIVTFFCGVDANGIYSIGYRIPSMLNLVQSIFSQAWGISAVRNYYTEGQEHFFSKTYAVYNLGMTAICSFFILSSRLLARLLFAKEFYQAWEYVPYLLIAMVFGAMSGYLGGIFSAQKEVKIFTFSTVCGALSNIVMSLFLVSIWGPLGAAVATMISYFIVWLIRFIHIKRNIVLDVKIFRDFVVYGILLMQSLVITKMTGVMIICFIEILGFVIILLLNKPELGLILSAIKRFCRR